MKLNVSSFLVTIAVAKAADLQTENHPRRELQASVPIDFVGSGCYDYDPTDSGWITLPRSDDDRFDVADIGIQFPWLDGQLASSIAISINGFIFSNFIALFIAPFDVDIDTTGTMDGYVRYKRTTDNKFVVMWEEVARYGASDTDPPRNTFQVVLSDVSYPDRHICFCYAGMEFAGGHARIDASSAGFLIGDFTQLDDTWNGVGSFGNGVGYLVDKSFCFDASAITNPPTEEEMTRDPEVVNPGPGGDPHITTWIGEHFEYHGQCDLSLCKDPKFADDLGLDIQIRTKIVRYWSYIKNVAIKIGNDILEIQGSPGADDAEAHYWVNFEYQGDLDTFAGFPVTQKLPSVYKRQYIIDLSSKYPGQEIVVELYKEFVRVRFNGKGDAFQNTVGLMGDYTTGKTLARDGTTVMDDFTEFGDEWQVIPSEPKLFREVAHPQFPELCIKPEDPRGERKRRLAESSISVEEAEAACAGLKDPLSVKDCVYDILATQDMGMVGAF